ncbi:uncharacterized protein ACR2FA_000088 [Aphomia sociella]
MSSAATFIVLSALAGICLCQRPSYAGRFPIGYPSLDSTTTTTTTGGGLDNRFGDVVTTTERLPIEANGDRDLVLRLKKLPIDKQPFWLINWVHLEEMRKNPQTYQHKPNSFIDFMSGPNNQNTSQFF